MSKKLQKLRVFSAKEFKEGTRLDKIYINIINPDRFKLNNTDTVYLDKLRSAFVIYDEEITERGVMLKLKGIYPDSSDRHLYQVIRDCKQLFGNLTDRNIKFDKMIQRERILRHIGKAQVDGDHKAVAAFEKLLISIDGTDKSVDEGFDPEMLKLPDLIFTEDPKVLFEEAEIVEHDQEEE